MDVDDIPLIAGHPALDFVNSVEGRGTDAFLNYLADYDRMAQWCARTGLMPQTSIARARRQAKQHPVIAMRVWHEAMDLRDALNRIFRALARADEPPKPAISVFNAAVAQAFEHRLLQPTGAGDIAWAWQPAGSGLEVVLWEIALSAAGLVTDADHVRRLRICANGPCDWMFLDNSRNGRRWCRMAVCGNSSKVRRFRERQRDTA